jgi:hypothetical protein
MKIQKGGTDQSASQRLSLDRHSLPNRDLLFSMRPPTPPPTPLIYWDDLRYGIETMKGPAESGQICSVGRRKTAKKIAKNKRCYANTLRPRSRMLLKVMKGG